MCLAPVQLENGVIVSCRKCWQCRADRINDMVGRGIAESMTASECIALTLTYGGGDVPEAAVLVYADFQRFLKRLRFAGFRVRYIVAGEYGSRRGRAHWHSILFFDGLGPEVVDDPAEREPHQLYLARDEGDPFGRVNWSFWPHGYVWAERPGYDAFRYLLKYALKDQKAETSLSHVARSTKPPLGAEYFRDLAHRYVAQGVAPETRLVGAGVDAGLESGPTWFNYSFRDVFKPNGERRQFSLRGAALRDFLQAFLDRWALMRPGQAVPESNLLRRHLDDMTRPDAGLEMDMLRKSMAAREAVRYRKFGDAGRFPWELYQDLSETDEETTRRAWMRAQLEGVVPISPPVYKMLVDGWGVPSSKLVPVYGGWAYADLAHNFKRGVNDGESIF